MRGDPPMWALYPMTSLDHKADTGTAEDEKNIFILPTVIDSMLENTFIEDFWAAKR